MNRTFGSPLISEQQRANKIEATTTLIPRKKEKTKKGEEEEEEWKQQQQPKTRKSALMCGYRVSFSQNFDST